MDLQIISRDNITHLSAVIINIKKCFLVMFVSMDFRFLSL